MNLIMTSKGNDWHLIFWKKDENYLQGITEYSNNTVLVGGSSLLNGKGIINEFSLFDDACM